MRAWFDPMGTRLETLRATRSLAPYSGQLHAQFRAVKAIADPSI